MSSSQKRALKALDSFQTENWRTEKGERGSQHTPSGSSIRVGNESTYTQTVRQRQQMRNVDYS